ncbi:MAG: GDSL-like Lipase/Acylhydrolase [Lentisphaerae bacterium ADurb.BinA184]|nr:MAG: GDSL-like Lipase/Acylhydrolase [Lentisphaerae bacterium ADurb.BinA184]
MTTQLTNRQGTSTMKSTHTIRFALVALALAGATVAAPIRIMPLGDSLTRGLNGVGNVPGGYRTSLYNQLTTDSGWFQANGVDFVGTASDNADPFPPTAPDTDWLPDSDHEGHGGQRIDQAQAGILGWLAATNPAIVLMHLGTNDVAQDYSLAAAPSRLDTLIGTIATASPDTHVVVAQIIPSTSVGENAQIQSFNSAIPGIVASHQAAGHLVTSVDMYSAVTPTNMVDTYHPGKAGYDEMADAWFAAIEALGNVENPPEPPPAPGATIVQTNIALDGSQVAIPPATDDLINVGQATLAGESHDGYAPFTLQGTSSTGALNDGLLGQDSVNTDTAFDLDGTWTSTYLLNTALRPAGYDITEIRTISGWIATRTNQSFELLFATVEDPALFVSYGTFSYSPGNSGSAMITLTDSTGLLATGVAAIRFNVLNAGTVYREFDVFGQPTAVPEPASLLLALLGGATLLRRRSRVR